MIEKRNNNGQIQKLYDDKYMLSLCKEYDQKRNAKEIAERENIKLSTLYFYIRKFKMNKDRRLYSLNEKYFHKITSQNKAYILGFLMADGCIAKSEPKKSKYDRLIIQLSDKDIDILKFIKKELHCDYDIKEYIPHGTYSNNKMCSLTINSMELCNDLIALGVVPNKTGKEVFPDIKDSLKRHFIRGFLDGDGWTTLRQNKYKTIGFISNYNMLQSISNEIAKHINVIGLSTINEDYRHDKKDKNIFTLSYNHQIDVENLIKFLYKNANFYLKRKYSKLT